ncbi:MAG: hypothetical protein LBL84_02850 [Candidatus Nomurabacteria bacterium]|jgi:hypothetical protein|nr:hypothetical protein [Candidatus Nomurabacteria bacterium]
MENKPITPDSPPPRFDSGIVAPPLSAAAPKPAQSRGDVPVLNKMLAILITMCVLVTPFIVGLAVFFGGLEELEETSTLSGVNSQIAESDYFNLEFPSITCGPSDDEFKTDKQQWLEDWSDCLDESWDTVQRSAGFNVRDKAPKTIAIISAYGEIDQACQDSSAKIFGSLYCEANDTIYVYTNFISTPAYTLGILFREYARVLQTSFSLNSKASYAITALYRDYPNQLISKTEAIRLMGVRVKANAECSALGIMQMSGRLDDIYGQAWLESFKNPSVERVAGGYGSKALHEYLAEQVVDQPNLTMQSCNTWKLADSAMQSNF